MRVGHKEFCVGIVNRSDEAIVMTEQGVRKARSLKRLPEGATFDKESLDKARGLPWDGDKDVEEVSKSLPGGIEARVLHEEVPARPPVVADPPKATRRMYIRKEDLVKYGFTLGCPACEASRKGKKSSGVPHTEARRQRIEEKLREDATGKVRVERADERATERIAEQIEEEEERRKAG